MPDPKIQDELDGRKKKKPDPTDVNIFTAAIKALVIGAVFILMGQWLTFESYWPFGLAVTFMGVAFPPIYLWIMVRLARDTAQPAPPRRMPN